MYACHPWPTAVLTTWPPRSQLRQDLHEVFPDSFCHVDPAMQLGQLPVPAVPGTQSVHCMVFCALMAHPAADRHESVAVEYGQLVGTPHALHVVPVSSLAVDESAA